MKFDIILCDPPWSYGLKNHIEGKVTSAAKMHYPTMGRAEMAQIPVADLADEKGALLFMWVTGPHMHTGVDLMREWGFDYKTVAFVWDKKATNPGYYTMSQCEFVIVGKRGSIPKPRGARNVAQFLSQGRRRHSQKPDEIHARIEEMFPSQRKIELFARVPRSGWTAVGNEIDGLDIRTRIREIARGDNAAMDPKPAG